MSERILTPRARSRVEYRRQYSERNRERLREYSRNYQRERRNNIIEYRRRRRPKYKSALIGSPNHDPEPAKHDLGEMNITCRISLPNGESHSCGVKYYKDELKSSCCHNGKLLNLPNPFLGYPNAFRELFLNNDVVGKNFRKNIRNYNNSNAFASMSAQIERFSSGISIFKISGNITHVTSSHIPYDTFLNREVIQYSNQSPTFSELFIVDPDNAINLRIDNPVNQCCSREIMVRISSTLDQVSPYADAYKRLKSTFEVERNSALELGIDIPAP